MLNTLTAAAVVGAVALLPGGVAASPLAQASSSVTPASAGSSFQPCASTSAPAAEVSTLGIGAGPGVSEALNAGQIASLNAGLTKAKKQALPKKTAALRYLDSGAIVAVDKQGVVLRQISAPMSVSLGAATKPTGLPAELSGSTIQFSTGWLHPEVKRIIGACLGFGGAGGLGFEELVQKLATPSNAAKFVIRRIGIFGAISCIGGVIWEYI